MSKKIKIEIEITGIDDWQKDASHNTAIGALFLLKADIKDWILHGITQRVGLVGAEVNIPIIEVENGQPEQPTT